MRGTRRAASGETPLSPRPVTPLPQRAWQRMLSGRRLDILDPSPLDVELDDIAHGIARVARWNGQTTGPHPLSVAQHSCLVEALALQVEPGLDRAGRLTMLLHDAPEYVLGDVITPLKSVLGEHFCAIETRLLVAIRQAFGLPAAASDKLSRLLKQVDRIAAFVEARQLAGFSEEEAAEAFGRPDRMPDGLEAWLDPWPPARAQETYRTSVLACSSPVAATRP